MATPLSTPTASTADGERGGPGHYNAASVALTEKIEWLCDPAVNENAEKVCAECLDAISIKLESEMQRVKHEAKVYEMKLQELRSAAEEPVSDEDFASEMEVYQKQEEELTKELEEAQKEHEKLTKEARGLDRDEAELAGLEDQFWLAFNAVLHEKREKEDRIESYEMQLSHTAAQLAALQDTNVLHDAFAIFHDGHFGTICGFRLGTLQSQNVPWTEINAAFGQVVLLLEVLAELFAYQFREVRLIPNGSFSRIGRRNEKNVFELFGSSDFSLGKIFWYSKFDKAQSLLLLALRELVDHVSSLDDAFEVPYPVTEEMIAGVPLKINFSSYDQWTRALKWFLIDLKAVLAWAVEHVPEARAMPS